jgi:hypothetical protein
LAAARVGETSAFPLDGYPADRSSPAGSRWNLVLPLGLGAAGAFVAYHGVGDSSADALTWAAVGAAAGLVLGWGCLPWIRRTG